MKLLLILTLGMHWTRTVGFGKINLSQLPPQSPNFGKFGFKGRGIQQ